MWPRPINGGGGGGSHRLPSSCSPPPTLTHTLRSLLIKPVRSSLRVRLQCNDDGFLDFLACLLTLDPEKRPTAALALQHPWLRPENAFPVEPYELP